MVGEGELRPQMEKFLAENSITDVVLTGFINQSEISKYYSVADVFVLCSEAGETWGLSVNEVLNFNVPVVVSSISGCASDLVVENKNGYTFEVGNIEDLASCIKKAAQLANVNNEALLKRYSYQAVADTLRQLQAA
jgi:glycosyltransferase involved in cell wall biosynthesis